MNRVPYKIMGIIITIALTLGGFTHVQAGSNQAGAGKPVYAYYYLWWSTQHWKDKLGQTIPTVLLRCHCLPKRMRMAVMPYPIMRAIN